MDPASATVMLLLSCTPDTLLCRELPHQARAFESPTVCQDMLSAEIERLSVGERRIIGRCEALANLNGEWAKLPDSTVASALERSEPIARPVPGSTKADQVATGSIEGQSVFKNSSASRRSLASELGQADHLTVVRVTRMIDGAPVTTAYVVGKD